MATLNMHPYSFLSQVQVTISYSKNPNYLVFNILQNYICNFCSFENLTTNFERMFFVLDTKISQTHLASWTATGKPTPGSHEHAVFIVVPTKFPKALTKDICKFISAT